MKNSFLYTSSLRKVEKSFYKFLFLIYSLVAIYESIFAFYFPNGQKRLLIMLIIFVFMFLGEIFFNGIKFITVSRRNFILFLLSLSFGTFFLIYAIISNVYPISKLLTNFIISSISVVSYLFILKKCIRLSFTESFIKLIKLLLSSVFISEFVIFILYLKFRDLLIVQLLFPDGKFAGSCFEPNHLGFILGIFVFLFPVLYKTKTSFIYSLVFLVILFCFNKAKFAVIAFLPSFFLGLFLQKIKINKNLFSFFIFSFLIFISLIALFVVPIMNAMVYRLSESDNYISFTTRFSFIFSAFERVHLFPFGCGQGSSFMYFHDSFENYSKIFYKNYELNGYLYNAKNLYPKNTLSYLLSTYGFIGLSVFFLFFYKMVISIKQKKEKNIYKILSLSALTFIFMEALTCVNIIDMFPIPIVAIAISIMLIPNKKLTENRKI